MRLRMFVPHDHIEAVIDDENRHYSDPDATDDQANSTITYLSSNNKRRPAQRAKSTKKKLKQSTHSTE